MIRQHKIQEKLTRLLIKNSFLLLINFILSKTFKIALNARWKIDKAMKETRYLFIFYNAVQQYSFLNFRRWKILQTTQYSLDHFTCHHLKSNCNISCK